MDMATGEKCRESTIVDKVFERTLNHSKASRSLATEPMFSSLGSKNEVRIGDETTIQYMMDMMSDAEQPLDDWSMFYCGGSTSIEMTLRDIQKKYKIELGVEKFDW